MSLMSLDSVLLQDGKVVAYALRQLRIHDFKIGCSYFVLRIWRYYYYGFEFEVFSNHKDIEYLFGRKE